MKLRKWQKFRTGDYVFVSLFFVIILVYVFRWVNFYFILNYNLDRFLVEDILSIMGYLFFFVIVPFIIYDFIARRRKYKTID